MDSPGPHTNLHSSDLTVAAAAVRGAHRAIRDEIAKVVVGQDEVIDQLLVSVFCGAHALVEGVPGLAKTLIISSLAKTLSLKFARIQFTPDLMPSDVTGTEVIQEDKTNHTRELRFLRGPIFANVVLADEINRTPPKTQSALLEAMQEGQVTSGGEAHQLPQPFFVLATQNPIEQEGTYPLPEAQLDRFMLHVRIEYPSQSQEAEIVRRTTSGATAHPLAVLGAEDCLRVQELVRMVPIADHLIQYALRLVRSTRVSSESPKVVRDYISWGAGPRASQCLVLAAKAAALLDGSHHVKLEHMRRLAPSVMRHRILTNFNAQADGVSSSDIVAALLAEISTQEPGGSNSEALSRLVS
ncbi:MAG: AAA family ATPase [Phycisphaerales bacterium]|nr:AAA family ATPase [Phycisphaerales bacterium]